MSYIHNFIIFLDIVLCSIASYYTISNSILFYSTMLYYVMLYYNLWSSNIQHHIISLHIVDYISRWCYTKFTWVYDIYIYIYTHTYIYVYVGNIRTRKLGHAAICKPRTSGITTLRLCAMRTSWTWAMRQLQTGTSCTTRRVVKGDWRSGSKVPLVW